MRTLDAIEVEIRNKIYNHIKDNNIGEILDILNRHPKFLKLEIYGVYQESLLHYAATEGFYDLCEYLISNGMDINIKGNDNETPLVRACTKNHLLIVKFLIEKNAFIDGLSDSISTPIISATAVGNFEIVEFLIKKGANLNRLHLRLKQSALDIAIFFYRHDIEKILLENGAKKVMALL